MRSERKKEEMAGTPERRDLKLPRACCFHGMSAASHRLVKLLPTQTDKASLLHLGRVVVSLLEKRDFHSLAERFGYALAYGREPAAAIEEELGSCIARYHASVQEKPSVSPSTVVKYFQENDSGLWAVVECVFITSEGCPVLAELIGTSLGEDKYISLEELSLIAA